MLHRISAVLCISLLLTAWSAAAEPTTLFDPAAPGAAERIKPNDNTGDATFTVGEQGIDVAVRAGGSAGYPGIAIRPPTDAPWDLGAYGHIDARITNTGEKAIYVTLRVDNPGHHSTQPWNAEAKSIQPGRTETVKVIFGYGYGFKPSFKLDPAQVNNLLIFASKQAGAMSFRVESITAGGAPGEKPPVNPEHVRIVPEGGVIFSAATDVEKDLKIGVSEASYERADDGLRVLFPASGKTQAIALRPAIGRWNLRDHLQVQVVVRNSGESAVNPRLRIESNGGNSDWASAAAPLAPGAEATITIPFRSSQVWQGPQDLTAKSLKGSGGSQLASNVVAGIRIEVDGAAEPRALHVGSIVANMPPAQPLPQWLGKRPPVEGEWAMTFEDNFDGSAIDLKRWNIYTSNYWDKRSHFSKDNVIVGDGVVRLRFEKKTGPHNDAPEGKVTDYATGFLDSYGKWTQRYGYFEARMKLPEAPGMWPAFWLMPDRGYDVGPQWKRADTANGGMEFDIMEYLSRWGPNRHTVAFHWDGYQKNHKSTGTAIYVAPDAEGYITSGLLWLPGLAVVYCNGQEVARWESPRICDVASYPIFTAVSGGWDNDPINDSQLPADFVVDYVRIWQRADLASEVDGPKPNDGGPAGPQQ